jgi:hypothetical protein
MLKKMCPSPRAAVQIAVVRALTFHLRGRRGTTVRRLALPWGKLALLLLAWFAAAMPTGCAGIGWIRGARPSLDCAGDSGECSSQFYERLDALENGLMKKLRAQDGPDEILALLAVGVWNGQERIAVAIKNDRAVLTSGSDDYFLEREVSPGELADLRAFLEASEAFDISSPCQLSRRDEGPTDSEHYEELVRLTRHGGRRVFMEGEIRQGSWRISKRFRALLRHGTFIPRWPEVERENVDVELLVHDPAGYVIGVAMDGQQVIVQVVWQRPDEIVVPARYHLRVSAPHPEGAPPAWYVWPSGQPVAEDQLAALPISRVAIPQEFGFPYWGDEDKDKPPNGGGRFSEHGGSRYWVDRSKERRGLWLISPGREPERLLTGRVYHPVVALDGRSLLIFLPDEDSTYGFSWPARMDLETKQVERINLPNAGGKVAATKRGFLLAAGRPSEPPRHFLVDPASGALQEIEGDFEPLEGSSRRTPQSAGGDRFWATKQAAKQNGTTIGIYDTDKFAFTPVRTLPGMKFSADVMWVDESANRVYAVMRGILVRFYLRPQR